MGVLAHVVPKTPPRKMCQKPHPEKNRFDWKSQGQIFQECVECQECVEFQECAECQGQMPRSRISGMPRSNAKVKNFRNAKVKNFRNVWNVWNVWNVKTKNGKIQNENKMGKRKKRNIKFSKICGR